MEKRLLLFLLLTFALIFAYSTYFAPKPRRPETPETAGGTGAPPGKVPGKPGPEEPPARPEAPEEPGPSAEPPTEGARMPAPVAAGKVAVSESEPVDTVTSRWVFDSWGGSVREVSLKQFRLEPDQDLSDAESWYRAISPLASDRKSPRETRSLTLDLLNGAGEVDLELSKFDWGPPEITGNRVVFRLPLPAAGVVLTKEIVLPQSADGEGGDPYHADVKISLTVTDAEKADRQGTGEWRIRLRSAGGVPLDQFGSGMVVVGAALRSDDVSVEEFSPPGKIDDETEAEVFPDLEDQGKDRILRWVGVHGRFFGAVLMARDPKKVGATQAYFEPVPDRTYYGKPAVNLAPALDF
ncbi:MAG: hypothetical protein ACYTDY_16020, partial [Planctomycetota bacterium]